MAENEYGAVHPELGAVLPERLRTQVMLAAADVEPRLAQLGAVNARHGLGALGCRSKLAAYFGDAQNVVLLLRPVHIPPRIGQRPARHARDEQVDAVGVLGVVQHMGNDEAEFGGAGGQPVQRDMLPRGGGPVVEKLDLEQGVAGVVDEANVVAAVGSGWGCAGTWGRRVGYSVVPAIVAVLPEPALRGGWLAAEDELIADEPRLAADLLDGVASVACHCESVSWRRRMAVRAA
ncbi:hypothetical protein VTI74DRAFT_8793 [Chaetomium olivicolor]